MASKVLSLLSLLLLGSVAAAAGPVNITGSRDITKVLDQFPNFSTLNRLLTQTKVADRINSRQTITVLAVADSAISSVAALPAGAQEKVLSLHVLLDYYDINKITNLPNATAILTTLFQASGEAAGRTGFLNATNVGDSQVRLGSAAAADGALTSVVVREIAMQPYNLSVIEISQPIVPPGITSSGSGNGSTPSPAPSKETPASPPKASATSPSPSASSPAPATAGPPASTPPTPSPTAAPSADAPASSADAPAGSADVPDAADDKKASSASRRRLVAGAGIGAAMGAAFFLVAP